MGEVLSARDEQIGRSVAVKRLKAKAPPAEAVDRFVREARIQGRLDHPAIVPVHELWHDDRGQPILVMKEIHGVTLAIAFGNPDAFTRQRLLRIFVDICLAIEFAHTRGVVHRDLKPANIVLGEFGEVYVLDWGIARVTGGAAFADIDAEGGTTAGSVLGTPGYMSPEQLYGADDLDGRSDVYALGCLLFELLAGEPLHDREHAITTTTAGVVAKPSQRAHERDIPPELDAICMLATSTDKRDRFATARQLGDAVQRFLDGDRDLALRKELAATELDIARKAIARGSSVEDRRIAMRSAGRALALDPKGPAAELVATLMLMPPEHTPPEVVQEMRKIDDDGMYRSRRLTIAVMCAYLSFWPILLLSGLHAWWFVYGGAAVCVATIVAVWFVPRTRVGVYGAIALAGNLVMIVLFSHLVGPFSAAPGLAVILAMTIGNHRRVAPAPVLGVVISLAVLAPWILEQLGLAPATTSVAGASLVFHTSADKLDPAWATMGLVLYVLLLIGMAVGLTRAAREDRRAVQRRVQIQAWQLRQLVAA